MQYDLIGNGNAQELKNDKIQNYLMKN
jgi:hypothetical protein